MISYVTDRFRPCRLQVLWCFFPWRELSFSLSLSQVILLKIYTFGNDRSVAEAGTHTSLQSQWEWHIRGVAVHQPDWGPGEANQRSCSGSSHPPGPNTFARPLFGQRVKVVLQGPVNQRHNKHTHPKFQVVNPRFQSPRYNSHIIETRRNLDWSALTWAFVLWTREYFAQKPACPWERATSVMAAVKFPGVFIFFLLFELGEFKTKGYIYSFVMGLQFRKSLAEI